MSSSAGRVRESASRSSTEAAPTRQAHVETSADGLASALQRTSAARHAGAGARPDDAMALQRSIGNAATARRIAARPQGAAEVHTIAAEGLQGSPSRLPHLEAIQRSFGAHSVAHVQAFTGARAAAASRAIGAEAYARGAQVAFAGPPSLRLAAHEAAHVVQQHAGVRLKDGVGRSGDAYERHADEVADRVVRGLSAESLLSAFAPPTRAPAAVAPAIQGAWISRALVGKDRQVHRFWKQTDQEEVVLADGWYRREDPKGTWEKANLEPVEADGVNELATEANLLPGPIEAHKRRYDRNNLVADPLNKSDELKIEIASKEKSKLPPELAEKVRRHGGPLRAPQKVYRWGEYKYEKNYVKNNGFRLGHVNFGSTTYGDGMYVATTPWGSAGYATDKDGSIIEVTIPAGTFFLDACQGQTFSAAEQKTLWKNPRFPQFLMVSAVSGWATIKDDALDLKIEFYRPSRDEFARVAPHLQRMADVRGYTALQIINRQLGEPIHVPPADQMLAMFINQPELKRQKVQAYIAKLQQFEFVPFLLSKGKLDFTDAVDEFLGSFDYVTDRYRRHFGYIEPTLRMWAAEPFSLSSADFDAVVSNPFKAALEAYKKERAQKKAEAWYKGWGIRYSDSDKFNKLSQFQMRLLHFRSFLDTVHSEHSDLAEADRDSHHAIKVGRHAGIVPRDPDRATRKTAITETMLRGVPKVATRKTPTAIVTMGLPGSGKSSVLARVAPDLDSYVVADPDDAKEGLPAYQAGLQAKDPSIADKVHDESKDIVNHVVEQTRVSRRNLIYDTTGTGVQESMLRDLKAAGYRVKLVYVHVPFATAKQRVASRAQQTGRAIPGHVMSNIQGMLPLSLQRLAPLADEVLLFDNSGQAPRLAWTGSGSSATPQTLRAQLGSLAK